MATVFYARRVGARARRYPHMTLLGIPSPPLLPRERPPTCPPTRLPARMPFDSRVPPDSRAAGSLIPQPRHARSSFSSECAQNPRTRARPWVQRARGGHSGHACEISRSRGPALRHSFILSSVNDGFGFAPARLRRRGRPSASNAGYARLLLVHLCFSAFRRQKFPLPWPGSRDSMSAQTGVLSSPRTSRAPITISRWPLPYSTAPARS